MTLPIGLKLLCKVLHLYNNIGSYTFVEECIDRNVVFELLYLNLVLPYNLNSASDNCLLFLVLLPLEQVLL